MQLPRVFSPRLVAPDTHLLGAELPVPGFGVLSANAFLVRAERPVLIDAGVVALAEPFLEQLSTLIALEELAYVFLTHTDPDHVGCLDKLLALAPRAKVITNFLGMGKLGLRAPIEKERVFLMNPGQSLSVGDRSLRAVAPVVYDAPETMCVFDEHTGNLFSADCFGAVLPELAPSARELPREVLQQGMELWTQVDAPWISGLTDRAFTEAKERFRELAPRTVLSSHLPPAPGMLAELLSLLDGARRASPFVGPDEAAVVQAALDA